MPSHVIAAARQLWERSLAEGAFRSVQLPRHHRLIALVAVVCFPLYYFIWHDVFPQPYENLPLRLLGAALFLPILFSSRWPGSARRYMPLYWHGALLYSLPFFFAFMLLKNHGAMVWMQSALAATFIMVLVLDWLSLLFHLLLGVALAVAAYAATSETPAALANPEHLSIIVFALVLGMLANYHNVRVRREQERAMLATASSIAHEMRTPLLGIRTGAAGLANYLPTLIDGYRLASESKLTVQPIRLAHLDAMREVLTRVEEEAAHANGIIDMLLVNVRFSSSAPSETTRCSMARCVDVALQRYPFTQAERELVDWEDGDPSPTRPDFAFVGNELLTVHVLFNLIKNALRHIAQAGKGRISIHLHAHQLVFRDTGSGVPADALPHIFDRFYTSQGETSGIVGGGIGLAFCRDVVESFGGSIACLSLPDEYTEFTLTFPSP